MSKRASLKLYLSLILFGIVAATLTIFRILSYGLADYRQLSPSIIKQRVEYTKNQTFSRLKPTDRISLEFTAEFNNLGSIAILFDNHQEISKGNLLFQIKESTSDSWYFSHEYKVEQLNPDLFFSMGFPIIKNSQGKKFIVELQPKGTTSEIVSLHKRASYFNAIYSYEELLNAKTPESLLEFSKAKIAELWKALHITHALLFYTLITVLIILFYKKSKMLFRIISKLKKKRFSFASLKLSDRKIMIILFFLTFLVNAHFARLDIDAHHDGILFKPALDVSEGRILFKETFSQYGALTTYIQATALSLFGQKLLVVRILTALVYGVMSVLLYIIFRRFLPKEIISTSIVLWIFMEPSFLKTFLPWSSIYALLFQLSALYCLLKQHETGRTSFAFLTGLMASLTMWCRQPVGIFTMASIVLYEISLFYKDEITLKKMLTNIIWQLTGFASVIVLFVSYFLHVGSFIDWIKQSFLFAYFWAQWVAPNVDQRQLLLQSLLPGNDVFLSLWSIYPLTTLLLFAPSRRNSLLWAVIFVALASWIQYYPIAELRHFYWAATPMMPLLGYAIYTLLKKVQVNKLRFSQSRARTITCLLLIAIHLPEVVTRITAGIEKSTKTRVTIQEPSLLAGMQASLQEAETYKAIESTLNAYLSNSPDKTVVMRSNDALFGALDPRIQNANKATVNWPWIGMTIYKDYESTIEEIIQKNQYLIISDRNTSPSSTYCPIDLNTTRLSPNISLFIPCSKLDMIQ